MRLGIIGGTTKFLLAVLVFLGFLWTVSYTQTKGLEKELSYVAEEKIREFVGADEGDTLEVAVPVITVSKRFVLFGKTTAKVAVYMRPLEPEESEDDHTSPEYGDHQNYGDISGIEFLLDRENGDWIDTESGQCSSEQCQLEGKKAFKRGSHSLENQSL